MNSDELANELVRLREDLGATREQLSAWSGLAIDRISEIEKLGEPSIYELDRICHGLAQNPSEVLRYAAPDPRRSVAWFRSELGERLDAADLRLLLTVAELSQNLHFLQQCLEEESPIRKFRRLRPIGSRADEWREGYQLGEAARAKLEKPNQPIPDLGLLLNRQGVYVALVELSSPGIEAASLWQADGTPTVLLNRNARRVKYSLARRAILGHELCHLLHDGGEDQAMARVTLEEGEGYAQSVEKRARAFSPAFLAPRKEAEAWWKTQSRARDLKDRILLFAKYWGFSFEGALWHLKNCGLIAEDVARDLKKLEVVVEADFEIESAAEPEPPSGALLQGWAIHLVDRAWHAGVISEGRRRELLAWR